MQLARNIVEKLALCIISTPLTNFGRARDSSKNSTPNQELITAFQVSKGWSIEAPMVAVSMANWPCEKGPDFPDTGCTAMEYVQKEVGRRKVMHGILKDAAGKPDAKPDDKFMCDSFEHFYCKDGKVIDITESFELCDWAHSGHQRAEFVIVPAYAEALRRQAAGDPDANDYNTLIPVIMATYTDLLDLTKNQMSINSSIGKQNPLTMLDRIVGGRRAMGHGMSPALTEREFRDWGAVKSDKVGKDGVVKASNNGAAPREAYLHAASDFAFRSKPGYLKCLLASEMYTPPGEKETQGNPEYIDLKEVTLGHDDPMCNISVIARLIEPSLEKLRDYDKRYGMCLQSVQEDPKKNKLSQVEQDVLKRGYAWNDEEFKAWMATRKKYALTHKNPVLLKPVEAFTLEKAKAVINSSSAPKSVREFLDELVIGNQHGAGEVINTRQEAFDVVYALKASDPNDAIVLEVLKQLFTFRDGSPEGYGKFCAALKKLSDKTFPTVVETTATPVQAKA